MDDSAVEQLAVKKAFFFYDDKNYEGDTPVTHLLCRFHSIQTLQRNLKSEPKAFKHLMRAVKYQRTKPGCEDSIDRAIRIAITQKAKKYITKEWRSSIALWANYSRCYSPLLLQV